MTPAQSDRRDRLFAAARQKTLIMGILNTTPDSFSDGGQFNRTETALQQARKMVSEGADIIDIGGESTRPGATVISEDEELARVLPVIEALSSQSATPLSIDTYKAEVAQRAVEAGAVLINDISGMRRDPDMAQVVADTGAGIVITYNRGEIGEDIDLRSDMQSFFDRAFEQAAEARIPKANIWLDPGVGFAKTLTQNFDALRHMDVMLEYDCPVLVGLSRKSFIGLTLDRPVDERLPGTLAAHLFAVANGARVVRAHDVAAHRDALTIFEQLEQPIDD
ncbi:MAG: dihydropteroate synthase [Henriciella sp.]|nr:dihydropteroate synthase [Henriciella sp.]